MYKPLSKEIAFEDFNQPVGMHLSAENRWVEKAKLIDWESIEKAYSCNFHGINGQVAKPARLALGALLIQTEYGYSDLEVVDQIQENPYLQYFCGFPGYIYEKPFHASLMVRFRKRFNPKVMAKINEAFIRKVEEVSEDPVEKGTDGDKDDNSRDDNHDDHDDHDNHDNHDNHTPPAEPSLFDNDQDASDDNVEQRSSEQRTENQGTMIVDATCAPSNIKYPQDTELLNDARKKLEAMIDQLHDAKEDGRRPRTYAGKAKKDYLAFARLRKKTSKAAHKTVGKLLRYVRRNLRYVRGLLEQGRKLPENLQKQLGTIEQLYEQQKSMFENRSHRVENRIVSLRQPFLRPIVRGKAKAPVEFGPKLDISVINGFVRLEQYSFEAYNESEYLLQEIEHYRSLYGCYPSRVLADKIYRNRKNLSFCKEHGIRLSGPALGRPKKDAVVDKKRDYQDICERGEVERDFSLTKRKFGLGLIRTYLKETTTTVLGLAVLAFNLHRVFRKVVHDLLCAFLKNVSMAICFKNLLFGQ